MSQKNLGWAVEVDVDVDVGEEGREAWLRV